MVREDITTIVSAEVASAAAALGVAPDVVSDLALQVADRVRRRLDGSLRYLAREDRQKMADQIKAEFTGANIDALARKYRRTPRRIRQILAEKR